MNSFVRYGLLFVSISLLVFSLSTHYQTVSAIYKDKKTYTKELLEERMSDYKIGINFSLPNYISQENIMKQTQIPNTQLSQESRQLLLEHHLDNEDVFNIFKETSMYDIPTELHPIHMLIQTKNLSFKDVFPENLQDEHYVE